MQPTWTRGLPVSSAARYGDGVVALDGGQVYVALRDSLVALSRRDGRILWRAPGACTFAAVSAPARIAVSCDAPSSTSTVLIDSATGKRLATLSADKLCSLDSRGFTALRLGSTHTHQLYRSDFATHRIVWSLPTEKYFCAALSNLVVLTDYCCAGDGTGFEIIDGRAGRQLAHHAGSWIGLDEQGRVARCIGNRVDGFDSSGRLIWSRPAHCSDNGYGMYGRAVVTDLAPVTEFAIANGRLLAQMRESQYPKGNYGVTGGGPFDFLVELGGAQPPNCARDIRFISPAGLSPIIHYANVVPAYLNAPPSP